MRAVALVERLVSMTLLCVQVHHNEGFMNKAYNLYIHALRLPLPTFLLLMLVTPLFLSFFFTGLVPSLHKLPVAPPLSSHSLCSSAAQKLISLISHSLVGPGMRMMATSYLMMKKGCGPLLCGRQLQLTTSLLLVFVL